MAVTPVIVELRETREKKSERIMKNIKNDSNLSPNPASSALARLPLPAMHVKYHPSTIDRVHFEEFGETNDICQMDPNGPSTWQSRQGC